MPEPKRKMHYVCGDERMLDDIAELWDGLRNHHQSHSKDFKQYYAELTFERRKVALLEKTRGGKIRVDVAFDEASGGKVGYCISSINQSKIGEVNSIYVAQDHRRLTVGDALMRKALAWMDAEGAESKIVEVGAGNEEAFSFYARYGFVPRSTLLKQKERV